MKYVGDVGNRVTKEGIVEVNLNHFVQGVAVQDYFPENALASRWETRIASKGTSGVLT